MSIATINAEIRRLRNLPRTAAVDARINQLKEKRSRLRKNPKRR